MTCGKCKDSLEKKTSYSKSKNLLSRIIFASGLSTGAGAAIISSKMLGNYVSLLHQNPHLSKAELYQGAGLFSLGVILAGICINRYKEAWYQKYQNENGI